MAHLGILFAVLAAVGISVVASEKKVVCYYGTWATYRWGLGKFDVEDINPELCTHLIYSFVGINIQGSVVSLDSFLDFPSGKDNFGKFAALKQKNPNLKTILAVGGYNEGSYKYSIMAASPTLRKNFINSALQMVLEYNFDGFDVDWEYPSRRDSVYGQADVDHFTLLLKELKEAFSQHGLLVTTAVAAAKSSASLSYDISAISQHVDMINLMAYDLNGAWDTRTGHNAPLHRGEGDENISEDQLLTVDAAVEYWLAQGCPPEKLVLGVPFYGRTFTLVNSQVIGVRAPSSGSGIGGPYTGEPGFIGYNEFCDMLRTQSWDVYYDEQAEVPYAVQGNKWVSYDDPDSIVKKTEYALSRNLAGVMMWSIETDDAHGICTGEDFPLLRAINRALGRIGGTGTTATTTTTTSSTQAPTEPTAEDSIEIEEPASTETVEDLTTTIPNTEATDEPSTEIIAELTSTEVGDEAICTSEGFVASRDSCSVFYICITGADGELVPQLFQCPSGLYWDAKNFLCNYPDLVNCEI